jgi:hypothetical protein
MAKFYLAVILTACLVYMAQCQDDESSLRGGKCKYDGFIHLKGIIKLTTISQARLFKSEELFFFRQKLKNLKPPNTIEFN